MCLPRRATGACIKKPAAPGGFFFDRSVWSCRRTMQFLTDGARHVSGIGVCWPIPGTKAITDLQNLPYPTAPRPGSTCIHPSLKTALDHAVAGQHWDIVTLLSQSLAKSAEKQQASAEVKSNVAPTPVPRMDATMPALQDAVSLRTRALHEAVRKGDAAQAKTLIASGVDLNARMDGHATPLLTAVSISSPKMVEVLLAAGADTSLVYNKGYDLLMFAAMDGNLETALLLIQHRVDLNRRSDAGRTALSIAMESKNARMVELLRSHGASA